MRDLLNSRGGLHFGLYLFSVERGRFSGTLETQLDGADARFGSGSLEVGYILTYRAGWKINTASLVTNIALAILLLFIGFLFYGEPITGRKLLGVVICCIGLFFLIK